MNSRQCKLCSAVLYGAQTSSTALPPADGTQAGAKEDDQVCAHEFFGSEWSQSRSVEKILIPKLERLHGSNDRLVHQARRQAERVRADELEEIARALTQMWKEYVLELPPFD
jgi:hypothetical protein